MTVKKSSPFLPSFIQASFNGARPLKLTFNDVKASNIASTSSFAYEPQNYPLKSTQQLNVDWENFENHTFFMSAEAKVNTAFDQIINVYPFDGTKRDVELFFENITGFDRWVYDNFPKFRGQLMFTGSTISETASTAGSYIKVKDHAGSLYPELSRLKDGSSVIDPGVSASLSIEMHICLPNTATLARQIVVQKMNDESSGFALYVEPTSSTSSAELRFSVVSGSTSMTVPMNVNKGVFQHICAVLDRETDVHRLEFYKDAAPIASSQSTFIGDMNIAASDFIIGSGTSFTIAGAAVNPGQTLSGTIDELRVFHGVRSSQLQKAYAKKSIYATDDLKLYYRFNEPSIALASDAADPTNAIVLDHSGHSLHSVISNFSNHVVLNVDGTMSASLLRQDASSDPLSLMIYEKNDLSPSLFPGHPDTINLNSTLLFSASLYDKENPNLITRLVPQHFLLEGALDVGSEEPEGMAGDPYTSSGIPGQGKIGNVQLFLSLLYVWARFFDEIKLYVDAFSLIKNVDYDTNVSTPNNFLNDIVDRYGFTLPPMFNDSSIEQFIDAENIEPDPTTIEDSIRAIQNELMRRVLINIPDVIRSKGTQHSIRSFLRAVGIDPDNSVRIRERGGPTSRQLSYSREFRREVGTMVEFTSSSLAISPFLSASRLEPGFPLPAGTFVMKDSLPPHGISDDPNDGLLTSGSWTVETIVKYTPVHINAMTSATQSLARMYVTSSLSGNLGLVANLLAISSSTDPKLVLYARPGTNQSSPLLQLSMSIPIGSIFDGDKWNVSFGCERNDAIDSTTSSSYFLRLATQNEGNVTMMASTSSYFNELITSESNTFRSLDATFNQYGTFLAFGQNILAQSGSGISYLHLNNIPVSTSDICVPSEARVTDFNGMLSDVRFWSKAINVAEFSEHVRNHSSHGVSDPTLNFNYVNTLTGSFERLRLSSLSKQETRAANTSSLSPMGTIEFIDFSCNGMHLTGTGFRLDADCVKSEMFDVSYISPNFDEAVTNDKVRIRSFLNQDNIDSTEWAETAPVYEIRPSEIPTDDVKLSIDVSLIDALNRDIVTMFSTLDVMDNAMGAPELQFASDYPTLVTLRDVYFNRLKDRLNFNAFFEFFRWFDSSIGVFIKQLVPRKTSFNGVNFTIESHVLERHKIEHSFTEQYINAQYRARIDDNIALVSLEGGVKKL